MTLTFNLPEQMFQLALLLLMENNCAIIHEIHAQMYKLWLGQIQMDARTQAQPMHERTYTELEL